MSLLDQDKDTGMWMVFIGLFLIIGSFIGDAILAICGASKETRNKVSTKGTLELTGDSTIDGANAAKYYMNRHSAHADYYQQMLKIYKDNSTTTYKLRILPNSYLKSFWSELPIDLQEFIQREYDNHPEWTEYNIH